MGSIIRGLYCPYSLLWDIEPFFLAFWRSRYIVGTSASWAWRLMGLSNWDINGINYMRPVWETISGVISPVLSGYQVP